jgi:putative restriction endonuclease
MTLAERAVLEDFLSDLERMSVNKSTAGESRKKPLLLLLVLAMMEHGRLRDNKIHFSEVEERLAVEHGGRPTQHGPKPEQPFFHLRTSPFWELTIPGGAPETNKKTVSKKQLGAPGAFAALRPALFTLWRGSGIARQEAVRAILQRWWHPDDAARVRAALDL